MSTVRAQTVSYYLTKAGYDRSRTIRGRIANGETRGFKVKTNVLNGRIEVRYTDGDHSGGSNASRGQRVAEALSAWEKALQDRYSVSRDQDLYGSPYLVVEPREAEQTPEAPAVEHVKKGVKLGENQKSVLKDLAERNDGVWYPGCGWMFRTDSLTKRILDSLVLRGLAEFEKVYFGTREQYRITEAGRTVLAQTSH